jgi:hypothetical protein
MAHAAFIAASQLWGETDRQSTAAQPNTNDLFTETPANVARCPPNDLRQAGSVYFYFAP